MPVKACVQHNAQARVLLDPFNEAPVAWIFIFHDLGPHTAVLADHGCHFLEQFGFCRVGHGHIVGGFAIIIGNNDRRIFPDHGRAEGLEPVSPLQVEVQLVLAFQGVSRSHYGAVSQRPGAILAPPLEPEDNLFLRHELSYFFLNILNECRGTA